MSKYFNMIFWGIILILLDININEFDILPDFIGYLLIIGGLYNLSKETGEKYFVYSNAFTCILLLLDLIIMFLFYFVNMSEGFSSITSYFLSILNPILMVLVVFYMYSGIINIIEDKKLIKSIMISRAVFVYVNLFITFIMTFSPNIYPNKVFAISLIIINFIVVIRWAHQIYKVRSYYYNDPEKLRFISILISVIIIIVLLIILCMRYIH